MSHDAAMSLADLLTAGRIVCGAEARSKKRALELLAESLTRDDDDLGQGVAFTSLIGRERLGSTAVGHGVALPHGRVDGIDASRGAFVRLTAPVDFEAADGQPVDLLFGLLVPVECGAEHLAALSTAAAVFDDRRLRDALRAAPDAAAVLALLAGDEARRHAAG